MDCDKKNLATTYIGAIPVDTLDSTPDYVLTERDVEDPNTGKIIRSMTRTPGAKLFGGGSFDNVAVIEPNNTIEVPEGQVIAAVVQNMGSYNMVVPADNKRPDFFVIKEVGTMLMVQNTGFITYPEGHQFIVGQDYWLATDASGRAVTDSTSGIHLFRPIDSRRLAIDIYTA